ncbi:MAG TPA: arsenite methyltransferase [Bacteroidales bacterium]|nr:arsenite methyltransferase [Bacteroidales bacterium]
MKTQKTDLKGIVKNKYGEIAKQSETSCCRSGGCCSDAGYTVFSDNYISLKGYNPDADLGLGCGLPTEFANIKEGDHVLDLGSGAGNDCFVARSLVGETGKVTGLDFTNEMLQKAEENNAKLGYKNVKFFKGDIEEMPFHAEIIDVVISNCVLNLVPDKKKAFSEIFRVLKKRGHFCISDVVLIGKLPESIKNDMAMYAGCVSGAVQKEEYLQIIRDSGFENVQIKKEKQISMPDNIMLKYLSQEELNDFKTTGAGIFSITVVAEKPSGLISNYNYRLEEE